MTNHVSIVGAGVAGLVLGQLLRKRHVPTVIWEQAKHYPGLQNFGITLHASSYLPLLKALDIEVATLQDTAAVRPLDDARVVTGDTIRVNRSQLLGLLGKDLDIRWSHKLVGVDRGSGARHRLSFTNSRNEEVKHESHVIVAADGVHSKVRSVLEVPEADFKLNVLPFVVYNGKRTYPSAKLPKSLSECLDDPNGLSSVRGQTVLKITSGYHDLTQQKVAINYTLSRAAGIDDEALLGRSKSDAEDLAARMLREAAQLTDLDEPFKSVFDPAAMKQDRLLHWLMRSGVLSLEAFGRHAEQGIFIFGDAANPTPILGGNGANNAMTSALQLTEVILSTADDHRQGLIENLHQSWVDWKDESERNLEAMHAAHQVGASL